MGVHQTKVPAMLSRQQPCLGPVLVCVWHTETDDFSPGLRRALASLLIEQNTNRVPELGEPPAERMRDWARMHLLTVNDAHSGRTRVLINNAPMVVH